MTDEEIELQIHCLADSRCKAKHSDYYDSLICVGGTGGEPPCFGCVEETRKEYYQKRQKAHGHKMSKSEVAEMNKRLGIK